MIIDRNQFFELQHKFFNDIPFNQTEEWLNSQNSENKIFFIDNTEEPKICCWGTVFNRKFIGKHLIIDGISYSSKNLKIIKNFFREIVNDNYSIVEISDISQYSVDYEIAVRQAGMIRPIINLCPLTIEVDLTKPLKFHRNWSRSVKKSLNNNYKFEVVESPNSTDINAFISLFNELKDRKKLGFSLNYNSILALLKVGNYKLFFIRDESGKYISGRIVYINKNASSYDVYAANSNIGILNGAAYFIQENILHYLKDNGIKSFDYGRISPSNDEMNNIYVAKNYSGGQALSYNGQWVYYNNNNKIGWIYESYKFILKKVKRY